MLLGEGDDDDLSDEEEEDLEAGERNKLNKNLKQAQQNALKNSVMGSKVQQVMDDDDDEDEYDLEDDDDDDEDDQDEAPAKIT